MTDYRAIHNEVFERVPEYACEENSPGLQSCVESGALLSLLSGRALDVGCGVGFAATYLSGAPFDFEVWGVDASDVALSMAQAIGFPKTRLRLGSAQQLPFEQGFFELVTCFDMLEYLDQSAALATLREIRRVMSSNGVFFGSVSCRPAGSLDSHGDDLHRTVQPRDWWLEQLNPDRYVWDQKQRQIIFWIHSRSASLADTATALYQEIYERNPWYGNAHEARCPGVRLLPHYRAWLCGPVIDLGCGRGHTVERLRELGYTAEGIDQIELHADMRIGDIARQIDDIERFESAICIDCVEHMHQDQLLGLFDNMRRVSRQAFSIHNGEASGTGRELHINRRPFEQWEIWLHRLFVVAQVVELHSEQRLYLTRTR